LHLLRLALDQAHFLEDGQVFDAVAQHPLVAVEDLAAPQRLADILDQQALQVQAEAGEAADDLGQPELAALAARQQDAALESAVRDRAGRQAGVDLVELLLIQLGQVVGGYFRQFGGRDRVFVLDLGEVHLGRVILVVGREGDVRRFRLAAGGQGGHEGSGGRQRGDGEQAAFGQCHDPLPLAHSVARKAVSAFLSASERSSPKRWPPFSISSVQVW
jgi:hypothetical protein